MLLPRPLAISSTIYILCMRKGDNLKCSWFHVGTRKALEIADDIPAAIIRNSAISEVCPWQTNIPTMETFSHGRERKRGCVFSNYKPLKGEGINLILQYRVPWAGLTCVRCSESVTDKIVERLCTSSSWKYASRKSHAATLLLLFEMLVFPNQDRKPHAFTWQ